HGWGYPTANFPPPLAGEGTGALLLRLGPEERPGIRRRLDLGDTTAERIDLPQLVLATLGHVEPLAVGAHPHGVGPPGVEVTSANFERGGVDGDHAGLGEGKEGPAVRR